MVNVKPANLLNQEELILKGALNGHDLFLLTSFI